MKKIIGTLTILSILLLILCGYNYSEYKNTKKNFLDTNQHINTNKEKLRKLDKEKKELIKKHNEIKEKNKDKLMEYEKWEKMIKEIEEKMQ